MTAPRKSAAIHATLRVADIKDLGLSLIELADRYPLAFRTERDFYPLIEMYVRGRVPGAAAEHRVEGGQVDFRFGGTNPTLLELVVAPRALRDPNHPEQRFSGHEGGNQIHASQNKTELRKLAGISQTRAKRRFLLLLDLRGSSDPLTLRRRYEVELPKGVGHNPVHVVYITRNPLNCVDFTIGGGRKGRKSDV